jgi:superfamily II DNA helicase RecQ
MTLQFFCIPVFHPQPAQDELNQFLSSHRVVRVERQWLADGERSCWAVCVETASGPGPLPESLKAAAGRGSRDPGVADRSGKVKPDYRDLLSPEDFAVYAQLRALRKQVAEREGMPAYAVLNNDQLAALVQRRVGSAAAFGQIEGVGPARVERYAALFLSVLQAAWSGAAGAVPTAKDGT